MDGKANLQHGDFSHSASLNHLIGDSVPAVLSVRR